MTISIICYRQVENNKKLVWCVIVTKPSPFSKPVELISQFNITFKYFIKIIYFWNALKKWMILIHSLVLLKNAHDSEWVK